MSILYIGIDLAKNVFAVHGVDLDFAHSALIVRHGNRGKDRVFMLPQRACIEF